MYANTCPDGGVGMHMFINDKYTCTSAAEYGTRSGATALEGGMGGHTHGGKGMVKRNPQKAPAKGDSGIMTVASMTDCEGPWKVKKGDSVVLKAEYDLKKHPL
jgi:hypothetical protein